MVQLIDGNIVISEDQESVSISNIAGAIKTISGMSKTLAQIDFPRINASITAMTKQVIGFFSTIAVSDYMASFKEAFSSFYDKLHEAMNNPYSYINYMDYQKQLDAFHWAWPYDIQPEELKQILEQVEDEKGFDKLMLSFFSKERIEDMFAYTLECLPRKHKIIYSQIKTAYNEKQYALINNAILSIIDNLLGGILKDKGNTKRKYILNPIIEFYADNYSLADIGFIFELQMLSNNIDMIFSDVDFNKHIDLQSNKKVRRHLSAHGVMYSNKRSDSVMLLNTLAALMGNLKYITPFKNSLSYNKKKKVFMIDLKEYALKNRITKQLGIEINCEVKQFVGKK